MDDYGYRQHHAPLSNINNTLTSVSPSYNPNGAHGFFSEGLPAFDQFQYDPFLITSDQHSFHKVMVSEGFDQVDIPRHDTPLPDDLLVYGRPSFESSDSIGTEIFGSPLLWSDALVTNGLDTGVTLLCNQMHQPMQVSSDIETKECNSISSDNDGLKSESGQSGRARRTRKRCARQMRGYDTSGSLNNSVADSLTWEILSQYFYMPIAQAARELNIGLTLFKKRCRELGVRRWPHRKLMSIQSLIKNVKEMENDGGVDPALSKGTVRNAIVVLENQRKLMEVMPDTELEAQTKRLRQACFKANYKKRRLMILNGDGFANSSGSNSSNQGHESSGVVSSVNNSGSTNAHDLEESDELRSLLFDSLSPSDCSFLNDYI